MKKWFAIIGRPGTKGEFFQEAIRQGKMCYFIYLFNGRHTSADIEQVKPIAAFDRTLRLPAITGDIQRQAGIFLERQRPAGRILEQLIAEPSQ